MTSFSALKNSSKSSLEKLTQELGKLAPGATDSKDSRFWYPNVDKAGNGYSVIRFLPPAANEEVPFVRIFEHAFKGPTGLWYFENSLTTIGQNDPVGEMNSVLWNTSDDDNSPGRKQARDQKRKLCFIANIYVIQDSINPENNGKVFLFKFGKKIFDKLNEAMNPQFADEKPLNPFDFWAGADFKLKIRNVEGYRNYDKSEFATPTPMADDDSELEAIWNQEHSLKTFIDPSNFKNYDELKRKLDKVLGLDGASKLNQARTRQPKETDEELPERVASTPKSKTTSKPVDDEADEDVEFFKSLAES